jgi:hypothetical protein
LTIKLRPVDEAGDSNVGEFLLPPASGVRRPLVDRESGGGGSRRPEAEEEDAVVW